MVRLGFAVSQVPKCEGPGAPAFSSATHFLRTWATLYNRVGVVKRHLCRSKVFVFSFVGGFCFCCCFCFLLIEQGPLSESPGWKRFHQPSIRSRCFRS